MQAISRALLLTTLLFSAGDPPPMPPAPEAEVAIAAPAVDGPLTLEILGPKDGAAMVGDLVELKLKVGGTDKPTSIVWMCEPSVPGFRPIENQMEAVFSDPEPGDYEFLAAIGDAQGRVAMARYVLPMAPNVHGAAAAPSSRPIPTGEEGVLTAQMAPQPQPQRQLTVEEEVLQAVNSVQTATRAAEAHIVAGSAREVANLIASGNFQVGDVFAAFERAGKQALGGLSAVWQPFFSWLTSYAIRLQAAGLATSPQTAGPYLVHIANILGALK